jgi:hypothetical protein
MPLVSGVRRWSFINVRRLYAPLVVKEACALGQWRTPISKLPWFLAAARRTALQGVINVEKKESTVLLPVMVRATTAETSLQWLLGLRGLAGRGGVQRAVWKELLVVLEYSEARDEMLQKARTIESNVASLEFQFCVTLVHVNDFLAVRRTPPFFFHRRTHLASGELAERHATYP